MSAIAPIQRQPIGRHEAIPQREGQCTPCRVFEIAMGTLHVAAAAGSFAGMVMYAIDPSSETALDIANVCIRVAYVGAGIIIFKYFAFPQR